MNKKRIGILGGTFDPIHNGHLVLAEYTRCELNLEKVVFVPAGLPPHKLEKDITSNADRFAMVELATLANIAFNVSDMEIKSTEISYTFHTLQKMKKNLEKEYEIYFITGADAMWDVETWNEASNLLKEFPFIVGTRPGYQNSELEEKIVYLNEKYSAKIQPVIVPGLDISSSEIRQRIQNEKSIKYLVPEAVETYIIKEGLYK